MTLPREVLPGRTYMVTRRCAQRQFLMRPDRETNEAFLYCLGYAAQKFDIEVLFTVAMSNHHHTGIHDPHGNYPEFLACFHQIFAKAQNVLRGRWENFWAAEQTSVVELPGPEEILEKLTYALGNPVKDHLVETAAEWPGASSYDALLEGRTLELKRPAHFFRKDGAMPETVLLGFSRPKGFEGFSNEGWRSLVKTRISRVEIKAHAERQREGRKVLGVNGILRQLWSSRPSTDEPKRSLIPRVASKNKWRRIELLRKNLRFVEKYRDAREAFARGFLRAIFPIGTYWLRRFADVICDDALFLDPERIPIDS